MVEKRKIDISEFLIDDDLTRDMVDVIKLERREIRNVYKKGITLKKISDVLNRTYADVLKGKQITPQKITKVIGPIGKTKKKNARK